MANRIARSLDKLRSQVNARWPQRRKQSDGWIGDAAHQSRKSDHNPHVKDGATGVVTALDITHDPKSGCDAGVIADVLVASRDPRIKYVIWDRQIIAGDAGPSPWQWRDYRGRNPHTMHVHISVKPAKSKYDDISLWAIPGEAAAKVATTPQPPAVARQRPTLKRGDSGVDVRYLQKLLGIPVDGLFGRGTEIAVKKAQREHRLFADGVVGAYTWAALAA